MSRNALALVDCNSREQLYQFLMDNFDRKATKNEMISPYDDQLIGKMNFRYGGMEHAMFFTYARSSEYPGMRFHNHKIIYLSLGVNEISSDIFNQICSRFGGFVDYDDDLELGWQKVERQNLPEDVWSETVIEPEVSDDEKKQEPQEIRQILKLEAKSEQQDVPRENRDPRRKEGRPERRRHEKAERGKEEANRGQRHERKDMNRTEGKIHNRSRGERNGQRRFEKKAVDKQEKTAGNEKQA